MDVWRCLVIFVLLHIGVSGITLPQCTGPTPQAIEFIEGMPGQTIICDGTGQSDEVFWLTVSSGTPTIVTQCPSPNSVCTNPGAVFTATRNSTSSTLTLTSSVTRAFASFGMRCQVLSSIITCLLDVVYPSEATCIAQYNTGSPQWTVSGSCTITKASSEHGRFNCSWLYTHNSNGAIQIAYEQTSNSSTSQIPGSNATHPYFSFTCNFSMPFPSVAGNYGYSTVLYPGNEKKPATFSGSSVVVDPTTPSHDCPLGAVKKGTTITCNCTITSLGSPPGTLAWNGQSGQQLHLINVTLSQLYTCELRRGTTVVKETTYKLQVAGEEQRQDGCLLRLLLLLLLVSFLPLPIPLPWPGYPIYVVLCRVSNQSSSTGSPRPDNWHPHYICGMRTNNVYFFAWVVTNDGRAVLIWSRSPTTSRFVLYGTETTPGTNSSGAGHEMNAPPLYSNVSPASGAANNGNTQTRQKEKNKHTGTDGSPRRSRQPEASVELTPVSTSSPPPAATVHGDNQASGLQASGTPRLRPLPEPSRMTSVERNSTAETSNINGRDKHPKLPPIGKPDNHP